ncbi:hypothetical protein ACP70R_019746 [Stipagrostis hirtigluma subsp. patula]
MAKAPGDARMAPPRVRGAVCEINALPNDVLLRAVSRLDARQLVQTCVLSRRWRDLWRSVPRINASRHEFDGMAGTDVERDVLFKKFVNRFLMLRNPVALDEFRLWYHVPDDYRRDPRADSEDANLWIRHALQCNARSVKLSCVFVIPGFFRSLQKGCTVLERLILRDSTIADPEISSQTLKVLIIDSGCHCTFDGRASISIPSLIDLHFRAHARIPLLKNMESLVTVAFGTSDDEDEFAVLPQFNNLATLTLRKWCLHPDFNPLIVFLQTSSNLVQLTLDLRQPTFTNQRLIGEREERSFTCEHLEIVKIVCSELDGPEDDTVLDSLKKLLNENGVTSDKIHILDRI